MTSVSNGGLRGWKRVRRAALLVAGNLLVFGLFFLALEGGYRIYREGLSGAVSALVSGPAVPYSSLSTGEWLLSDRELGYRLNPARDRINSRSLRGPEISMPKPKGMFRVIVLGDSIPWDEPSFVDELSSELARRGTVEVINASVPGYTSYQELTFFKRYLTDTEPDVVLWCYCMNDNHRFLHRFDKRARLLITDEARQSLRIKTWWDRFLSRSYVLTTLRTAVLSRESARESSRFPWETRADVNVAWKDYPWRDYESYLDEMIALLKPRATPLAVLVFPFEPQVKLRKNHQSREYILKPQRTLAALTSARGLPFLDPYARFAAEYEHGGRLYRDGIHLNPEGHHVIAVELIHFLDQHRLVPAPAQTKN